MIIIFRRMHQSPTFFEDSRSALNFECPGFCGKIPSNLTTNLSWIDIPSTSLLELDSASQLIQIIMAECKPCPWGMRNNGHRSLCQQCNSPLNSYDYLFLIFNAIAPFFANSTAIGYFTNSRLKPNQRRIFWLFLQTFCAFLESTLALFCSIFLFPPIWNLRINGCQKDGTLREWYSMWNNPSLEYNKILQCSYELVYPLFSFPFVLFAFNLCIFLVLRPLFYALAALSNGRRNLLPTGPFYAALWTLPLLTLAHSILSGLLYALFPYLALFASLIHLVIHLSAQSSPQQQPSGRAGPSVCGMFRRVFCCFRRSTGHRYSTTNGGAPLFLALLIHFSILTFSILSMVVAGTPNSQFHELNNSTRYALLLAMPSFLPVPLLFFILTVRLTAPNAANGRTHR